MFRVKKSVFKKFVQKSLFKKFKYQVIYYMSVTLVRVTKANIAKLVKLQVSKEQKKYVAPIKATLRLGKSKSETYEGQPVAYWMRAIKYKQQHVGIILLRFNPKPYLFKPSNYQPGAFLIRLMVATNVPELKNVQGLGIGRKAVAGAKAYAKKLGYKKLYSSFVPGKHSPEKFYLRVGFKKTGKTIWGEKEIVLKL